MARRRVAAILQPPLILAAALLVALGLLCASPPAAAQGATTGGLPSADELQIFQNLGSDQQDAILKQLTGGGSSSGSTGPLGGRQGQNGERQPFEGRERVPQTGDEEEEETKSPIPVLKAGDWVIIEADFRLPPRPLSSTLQALYLSQNPLAAQNVQSLQALQGGSAAGLLAQQQNSVPGGGVPGSIQPQSMGQEQPQLTDEQKKQLTALMELLRYHNPYELSHDGVLTLPGFPGIALLGLTEDQATLRLKAVPQFHDMDIRLTLLPLKKTGFEGLKAFGYDLFSRPPSTFAPVTNVPVPADYVLGPGDQLEVQLYGNQNRTLHLIVARDGRITLPEIGPIAVSGQLFNSVKNGIEARVASQMIGVHASVSMGDTRSIRVFVLGEAKRAGTYTVSGLGTITSALFAAGGVKASIGSLRNIQLKRRGALVRTLDLYDLLIRGDTRDDSQLLPGDVIFVPPLGATVAVDGEVRRPAIYEIKNESTVADLVQLAGGLTAQAEHSNATLTRIDETQRRVVIKVEAAPADGRSQSLRNGDLLRVPRLRPTMDSGVTVQGHVFTEGNLAYRIGMRLTDAIHSVDDLRPNADIHYLLIRRELPPDRRVSVLSADLAAALAAPGSSADVPLMPRDRILVFDLISGRDLIIQPLMDELATQSDMQRPKQLVHVDGRVKVPGDYPLEPNMTVADLVRAGGGLADEAYGAEAELTRYQVMDGGRRTQLIQVSLAEALRGNTAANVQLQPFDSLSVREVPEWHGQESVVLNGEVRFPGRYSIRRGETLRSVIARAGGLTDFAFPEGSVFSRQELKRREQEQMDMLADRMQRDLAILALQATAANQGGGAASLSIGQSLLAQLRGQKAIGRLVIDLPRAMREPGGSAYDVVLHNNDELIVPRFQQEVTVIGEVQNSTSHLFSPGLARDDYISLSGGMTSRADRSKIYIVRANGSVVANGGSRWFQFGGGAPVKPGDTVVVPLDAEHMPALPFWQAVTSIIYNVAIAAAAVHSF